MKPKISVIVQYNGEETVVNTLKSLKNQTFKDFEVVLVDDTLNKKPVNFEKNLSSKVIKNKRTKGLAGARNAGIMETKADRVAFTDSDCYADKDWLSNIYAELKKEEVVMGKVIIPKSSYLGDSISLLGFPGGGNLGFEKVWKVKDRYTNHFTGCNFGIRKSVFKKNGLFDETFPHAANDDAEYSYRIFKNGVKIKYSDKPIIYHLPRDNLSSFIKWQVRRGRGNYHFKRKLGNVKDFVKLRLWYAKNVIQYNIFKKHVFLVIPLLFLSFILQQYGFMMEKIKSGR